MNSLSFDKLLYIAFQLNLMYATTKITTTIAKGTYPAKKIASMRAQYSSFIFSVYTWNSSCTDKVKVGFFIK